MRCPPTWRAARPNMAPNLGSVLLSGATSQALPTEVTANGLRSPARSAHPLRALEPFTAPERDWSRGSMFAAPNLYRRMRLALHSPTYREAPWPA